MSQSSKVKVWTVLAVAAVLALIGIFTTGTHSASAITMSFSVPHVATSSLATVGPSNANTVFSKDSGCVSRIITTTGQPIMLSFTSSLTPTAQIGHLQAASTTVAYDNGTYGCDQFTAYGYGASTSITVTQLNQ